MNVNNLKVLLFAAVMLILPPGSMGAQAEDLGCTLQRPGPFLDGHKGIGYRKDLHEDRSEEHLTLASGETVVVLTHGCMDSWGWTITLSSKTMRDKPASVKAALSLIKTKVLPAFLKDTDEKGSQQLVQQTLDKLDKAVVKQFPVGLEASLCDRRSTLDPESKACVEPIALRIQQKADNFSIVVDYQDLEN